MTYKCSEECQSCKLRELRYESLLVSWCGGGIQSLQNMFKEKRFRKGDEEQNCHDCSRVAK